MSLSLSMKCFSRDEDGAVTVDWVVLTGAVVGLTLGVIFALQTATEGLTTRLATDMAEK
jgi:Flp pilus assembly pilin Flp